MNASEIHVGMEIITNENAKLGQRGVCGTVVCIDGEAAEIRIPKHRYSPHGTAIPDGYRTWVYPIAALDVRTPAQARPR